jgi:hypothetical protein
MTDEQFRKMFPKASVSFATANSHLVADPAPKSVSSGISARSKPKLRKMTAPELEYAFILEHAKRKGEIADWKYEGVTLRWDGLRYTPDFIVFPPALAVSGRIKMVEVKGPFIAGNRARAVERFRHARTHWTQFDFELWQRSKDGQWSQIR